MALPTPIPPERPRTATLTPEGTARPRTASRLASATPRGPKDFAHTMNSGHRPDENQTLRPETATSSTRGRPAKTHRFTPVAAPGSLTAPDVVRPASAGQTHSSDTRDLIFRRGLQPTVIVRRRRGSASEAPAPLAATDAHVSGAAASNALISAPISATPAPSSARASAVATTPSSPPPGIGAATALSKARAARAMALEAEARRREEAALAASAAKAAELASGAGKAAELAASASAAEIPSEGARPAAIDATSARSTATPSAKAASVQPRIPTNPTPPVASVGAATALKQAREAARAKADAEAAARATEAAAKAADMVALPSPLHDLGVARR
jgi:hypothetical protein